jgi:hypothetical protein
MQGKMSNFENGGTCRLRPKSKPKNSDSNNDAKLGKRSYARQKNL